MPYCGGELCGLVADGDGNLVASLLRLGADNVRGRRHRFRRPVGTTDNLDEVVLVHHVAHRAADDIIEQGLGLGFRLHRLHELQGIGDPPAGGDVEEDVGFIVGRDLVGFTIPDQYFLLKEIGDLDERDLEVESGLGHRLAHRGAELGDHDLLSFFEDVHAVVDEDDREQNDTGKG